MDDALALEKVVNGKLLDLHWTAQQANDPDVSIETFIIMLEREGEAIYFAAVGYMF